MTVNKKDSKTFCILPWVHLEIQQEGNVYPCCRGQFNVPLGNTHKNTPEEIWNSDNLKKLRLDMLNGRKSKYCTDCYNIEECGGVSPRQKHNRSHQNEFHLVDKTKDDGHVEDFTLSYLGLRFSNKCNLKCHYCDHNYSTAWFSDHKALGIDPEVLNVTESFPSGSDLLNFVERNLSGLGSIYIAGGEPLLEKVHLDLLDLLIEKNRLDICLVYNTNLSTLTHFKERILDRWKKFKNVVIDASIDSHQQRNDYIRYGAKWSVIESNINSLKEYSNITTRIYCTVSIFNILTLSSSVDYWLSNGLIEEDKIIFNLLEAPLHYNIQSLDPHIKQIAANKLKDFGKKLFKENDLNGSLYLNKQISNILNFLNSADLSIHRKAFVDTCEKLDKIRGENWREVLPELDY
jgi:radical SAM protein with 4Fe4S-binding SPASM domain